MIAQGQCKINADHHGVEHVEKHHIGNVAAEDLTAEGLVDKLLSEYDVDRDRAETDVYAFIVKLRESGLLDE